MWFCGMLWYVTTLCSSTLDSQKIYGPGVSHMSPTHLAFSTIDIGTRIAHLLFNEWTYLDTPLSLRVSLSVWFTLGAGVLWALFGLCILIHACHYSMTQKSSIVLRTLWDSPIYLSLLRIDSFAFSGILYRWSWKEHGLFSDWLLLFKRRELSLFLSLQGFVL